MKYEVKQTGKCAYSGEDDLGVYQEGNPEPVKTWNTLGDNYAYTNAKRYAEEMEAKSNV